MNGTESEGFEPESELDLGIPSQTRTAGPLSLIVFLAALPAKWRAEAAEVWNGDGVCPDGYIDGIQRRRCFPSLQGTSSTSTAPQWRHWTRRIQ